MKTRFGYHLLLGALVVGGFAVPGTLQAAYGPAKELHFDSDQSVQKKLDLMTKKLSLTPNQGFRVKQALDDQATKMELLKKEYYDARKKIADDTDGSFRGILNPVQQETYEKIKPDILGKTDNPMDNPDYGRRPYR
jgi:hypothetical protein